MVPELRARGIGETLDAAVSVYRARFGRIVLLAAAVVVPVQVFSTLVLLSAQPDNFSVSVTGQTAPSYTNPQLQLTATLFVLFITLVSGAFVVAVCARPLAQTYLDRVSPTGTAPPIVKPVVAAMLGASVLVALGDMTCFIVALPLLAVTMPALVVENTGPVRAIGRSFALSGPHFFRALGVVATVQALEAVLNLGLTAAIAVVFRNDAGTAAVLAQGFANALAVTLVAPFSAAAAVVLYFDLRIRSEAFDIQLLMQRATARVPA